MNLIKNIRIKNVYQFVSISGELIHSVKTKKGAVLFAESILSKSPEAQRTVIFLPNFDRFLWLNEWYEYYGKPKK